MTVACEFDHLVLGARTLEQGAGFIEELLGARPQLGGRHVAMGTHNALLRLGAKSYLEVIANDPDALRPQRPRWFGLDSEHTLQQLHGEPRLLTWVARCRDIEAATQACPLALGTIHRMRRGAFSWRITIPGDGALIANGLIPALIQWDGVEHPADKLEDRGCRIARFAGSHPSPAAITAALDALGLAAALELDTGGSGLTAEISTPGGMRRLAAGLAA